MPVDTYTIRRDQGELLLYRSYSDAVRVIEKLKLRNLNKKYLISIEREAYEQLTGVTKQ